MSEVLGPGSQHSRSEIVNVRWLLENMRCQHTCASHTDVPGYVALIAEGKFEEAYDLISETNPFSSICGRVCHHPCEAQCKRGKIDEPVAIDALKRFVADYVMKKGKRISVTVSEPNGKTVAIIGAGPAGLTAAYYLVRLGYAVTIFESQSVLGGMLYLGLPAYRLPRDQLRFEIEQVLKLGVEVRTETKVGKDVSFDELRADYDVIFIATGAHINKDLALEGAELDGVLKGVDFLREINLGRRPYPGQNVVVIGGGNVAVDAARSAIRLIRSIDGLSVDQMRTTLRAVRSTLNRLPESPGSDAIGPEALESAWSEVNLESRNVHLVCLETRHEMPAHEYEVAEALREGVILHPGRGPKRVLGRDGNVVGLETVAVDSLFDSDGRFNPIFLEGTESPIEADTVIIAIGQVCDLSNIESMGEIALTAAGTISVDPTTLATNLPGVFAGGDVVSGPKSVIDAIGAGRRAAASIDTYLSGEKRTDSPESGIIEIRAVPDIPIDGDYDRIERHPMPTLPLRRRIGVFDEVETGFTEKMVIDEAKRCLQCSHRVIIETEGCVSCGRCAEVCPYGCITMMTITNEKISTFRPWMEGEVKLKDDALCIRCGLCRNGCPASSVTYYHLRWISPEQRILTRDQ